VDEDRSTQTLPPKRIKSEPPMFQSTQDNPIIINDASLIEDDSDVEFIEERVLAKKEPMDSILVDMTMVNTASFPAQLSLTPNTRRSINHRMSLFAAELQYFNVDENYISFIILLIRFRQLTLAFNMPVTQGSY
jgi:hypothetical protein